MALLHRPRRLLVLGCVLLLLLPASVLLGRRMLATHHLKVGRDALERYHQDEARPHLEACLRLWPNKGEALLLMARAARRSDALAAAEEYLEQYQRLHGQSEEWLLERLLHTAAKGETDKVAKYCRHLVEENSPAASLALEAMVQGYFHLYRLGEGYAVLQTWLERQPNNTQALLFQAGLHTLHQRHPEAVAVYERILQLDPEHDLARGRLAVLLIEDRKYPEALSYLHQVRCRQPDNPMIAVQLARCFDDLGQQDQAELLLDEVLARYPHFSPAEAERGRLALRQGQLEQAEKWLRQALDQEPSNQHLRYLLIQCLHQRGKSVEVDDELQRLKRLETNLSHVVLIATKEMPQRPQDPLVHQQLGQTLLEMGRVEEGLYWLQRAVRENPSNASAHRALADYYQRAGKTPRTQK